MKKDGVKMNKALISLIITMMFFMGSCGGEGVSCSVENEIRIVPCLGDSNKQQKQICSQGDWIDKGICYLCKEDDTRTVTCENDELKEQKQVCRLGDWRNQGFCYLCNEFDTRIITCVTDNAKQQKQICSQGDWVDEGPCICREENTFCHSHKGLNWSDKAEELLDWDMADQYCCGLKGRIPTISELRTLVQNCPGTEVDGRCNVSDDCLSSDNCWDSPCVGCERDESGSGEYSVFGDTGGLWSSSKPSDRKNSMWFLNFSSGYLSSAGMSNYFYVRCIRVMSLRDRDE